MEDCLLSKHTFKSKERLRNQKIYVVDTGIINNREVPVQEKK